MLPVSTSGLSQDRAVHVHRVEAARQRYGMADDSTVHIIPIRNQRGLLLRLSHAASLVSLFFVAALWPDRTHWHRTLSRSVPCQRIHFRHVDSLSPWPGPVVSSITSLFWMHYACPCRFQRRNINLSMMYRSSNVKSKQPIYNLSTHYNKEITWNRSLHFSCSRCACSLYFSRPRPWRS